MSPPRLPRPAWLPDELCHAGRENLDAGHVAQYDEKEDANAVEEVALLREFGLGPRSHVVEIGAGTGQFAVAVAPTCERVVAIDVSPLMLDALRTKVAALGLSNVEVVQGGFLTYEHAGPPADVVYSRLALHHLPDVWKALALARARRVLRPGGVLRLVDVVYAFEPDEAPARLEAWCAAYGPGGEGQWGRADVEEHIREEHSTFTWPLEAMIDRSGFAIERGEYSEDGGSLRTCSGRPAPELGGVAECDPPRDGSPCGAPTGGSACGPPAGCSASATAFQEFQPGGRV